MVQCNAVDSGAVACVKFGARGTTDFKDCTEWRGARTSPRPLGTSLHDVVQTGESGLG